MPTTVQLPLVIVSEVSADAALAAGRHTPVNATTGAITMTLPAASSANAGARLSVAKTDASANAVTISGSIRGATSSLTVVSQHETVTLVADSAGSWWPTSGYRTKAALDAAYASGSTITWQVFNEYITPGTTNSVTLPVGTLAAEITCVGGAGGGGSGRKGPNGAIRCGGGGGAPGVVNRRMITGTALTESLTIVVGAGGTGGAAQATGSTNGNNGGTGAGSSVVAATSGYLCRGVGGGSGLAGTATSGAGGTGSFGIEGNLNAGSASTTGAAGSQSATQPLTVAVGGNAGGGITTADAASAGGAGSVYTSLPTVTSAAAGTSGGGAGGNGAAPTTFQRQNGLGYGAGGAGGGSSTSGNGGAGGAGGFPGGGGGGGGAAVDGVGNSGAGGAGADGYVCIRILK